MVDQPQIDPASLAAITCPVTVMAGEFDVVLYEETHRIMEAIPGAEEYIVPGAEHTLPKICPDVVSDVLLQTIARNDVRRPVRGPLPADGVIVVPVDDSWEEELEELYRRVDAEPGTSGWVDLQDPRDDAAG
ncbi:alpha/beta fold hydrolase, partial [Paratractidigestivibacter sp.]|uniref:alpha/beta fold hydrolase n=1 Tax=Paratractidigestivibacter sp. TaxID=2847316 RepID=UPI004026AB0E